tara:strand:- start:1313 stop:2266 length:954 start_codon:yes stop_codon:yes gene_type:complete
MNVYTNSLYTYDITSGSLKNIEEFPIEGANGVGKFTNVTEFYYHGDTLLFYDRTQKMLIAVDSARRVIFRNAFGKKHTQTPYGMWSNWINPEGEGYSMTGSAVSYSFLDIPDNVDSLEFSFDPIKEELIKSYLPIPKSYTNKSWLTEVLRYYREFNFHTNEYIYSWPISDSIYVKDKNNQITPYYMGTKNIGDIQPLPSNISNKESIIMNVQRKLNFYYEQGAYSYLYYDKYRKLLFRCAFSGIKEGRVDINNPYGDTNLYDRYLIVSDSAYNKIGEFNLDDYLPNVIVIYSEGLLLLRKVEDEDYLVFDRFLIEKL